MGRAKIKTFVAAIILILLTFMGQATVAYYQTVGKATNVVTSGDIRLIIHEKTKQGTDFQKEGVCIVPGDIVSKEVTIESDCEHPFYLRVKMVYGVDSKELSADNCFKLDINEEYWELHDGWYYYKGIVKPSEITPYVFSQVEIVGSELDNDYIGKTLSVTVNAQAVQSENNPITDGNTYTASGWPKE